MEDLMGRKLGRFQNKPMIIVDSSDWIPFFNGTVSPHDLIIGTFCLEKGHQLLHMDRDFD